MSLNICFPSLYFSPLHSPTTTMSRTLFLSMCLTMKTRTEKMDQIKCTYKGVQSWGIKGNMSNECYKRCRKGILNSLHGSLHLRRCACIHEWLCVYKKNIYMYIPAYTCFLPQSKYLQHYPSDVLNILFCVFRGHLETLSPYLTFINH